MYFADSFLLFQDHRDIVNILFLPMNHEFSTHRGEERIINGTGEQWDREAHLEKHKDKEKLVLSSQVERLGRLSGLKFKIRHKKLPGA